MIDKILRYLGIKNINLKLISIHLNMIMHNMNLQYMQQQENQIHF